MNDDGRPPAGDRPSGVLRSAADRGEPQRHARQAALAGGQAVSDALTKTLGARVPLLGQIPLDTRLREAGDAGAPIVLAEPEAPAAQALAAIADSLAVRQRGLSGMSLGLTPVRR